MSDFGVSNIYVNPDHEGYLMEKFKLAKNAKTWCSLQGPTLYLQRSQGVVQTIDMPSQVHNVRQLENTSNFEVCLKKGRHTFLCQSPNECASWITALLKAMALKSNGHGQSHFNHSISKEEENPYAEPGDIPQEKLNPESVYEEVSASTLAPIKVSPDTGQHSGTATPSEDKDEQPPALPSMESRLLHRQVSAEYYVDGASVKSELEPKDVVCTEAAARQETPPSCTIQEGLNDSEEGETYENFHDVERESQLVDSGTDNKIEEAPEYEEPMDDVVVLRSSVSMAISRASAPKPATPTIKVEEPEEPEEEFSDVFEQLDQALTCQEVEDIALQHPLRPEDLQPLDELKEFLSNNRHLVQGSFHHPRASCLDQDPVNSLKLYLEHLSETRVGF